MINTAQSFRIVTDFQFALSYTQKPMLRKTETNPDHGLWSPKSQNRFARV